MPYASLLRAVAIVALVGAPAVSYATSVSTSQGTANNFVAQKSSATASAQSGAIVAGNVGSALGGGGGSGPPVLGQTDYFNLRDLVGKSAAGERPLPFNAWVSGGYTGIDAKDRGGEFDGRVINVVGGVDYKFTDRFIVGGSVGYENLDIDTTFNRGTFKGDGWGFGPYLGFKLSDQWRISGLFNYSLLNYDVTNGNARTSGTFDATRWTTAANLSGDYKFNKWLFGPTAGVLYMQETQENYRDSANAAVDGGVIHLGRASAGGTLGYDFGRVKPYAKLLGEYDFRHEAAVNLGNGVTASNDRLGAVVGGGVNFALVPNRVGGGIEATYNTLGRENLDVYTVKGRLAVKF